MTKMTKYRGRAWKYGDDISTDLIYPGRYLDIYDPKEMGQHAMRDLDPGFARKVNKGNIIVAGKNFGCGSSREQASICLKSVGINAIIARSFARIFYRNSINQGIAVIVSSDAYQKIRDGDKIEVDLKHGVIKNITRKKTIKVKPLPSFIMEIIEDGGLIENLRKKLSKNK